MSLLCCGSLLVATPASAAPADDAPPVEVTVPETSPGGPKLPPAAAPPAPRPYPVNPRRLTSKPQAGDTPEQRALRLELAALEAKHRETRPSGSIALIVVGGVSIAAGAFVFGFGLQGYLDNQNTESQFTNSSTEPFISEATSERLMIGGGITGGVGLALLIPGLVRMFSTIGERRTLSLQIRSKRLELQATGATSSLDFDVGPNGALLTYRF